MSSKWTFDGGFMKEPIPMEDYELWFEGMMGWHVCHSDYYKHCKNILDLRQFAIITGRTKYVGWKITQKLQIDTARCLRDLS